MLSQAPCDKIPLLIVRYVVTYPSNQQIHRKSEGVVTTGEPLLEIGDPAALEIAVDVLSADAVLISCSIINRSVWH